MLDSGSTVSLVQSEVVAKAHGIMEVGEGRPVKLVTASGDPLPIVGRVHAPIQLGELNLVHEFVVVQNLVSPVLIFCTATHLLDFTVSCFSAA